MAMNAETIGLLVAGWGAVTGTVAIAIQLTQYFTDRSKLKLHAFMSMASNEKMPEHHLVFTIEVVNHGRRVSYIRRAGIQLEPSVMDIGGKWTRADESELTIFDADRTGRTIELAEGKRHLFVLEPFREKIGDTFRDTEVAFVIDSVDSHTFAGSGHGWLEFLGSAFDFPRRVGRALCGVFASRNNRWERLPDIDTA